MIRSLTAMLLGIGFFPGKASGQISLVVPTASVAPEQTIAAKVQNTSASAISYCVEFGQHSPMGVTIEATPIPFYIEHRQDGKWSVLLIGPDIGSTRRPVVLRPGESHDFPFRLLDRGRMRLVLRYWIGEREDVCSEPKKGRKTVRSAMFTIAQEKR